MRYKTLLVLAVSTLGALPVAAQAQDKKVYVSLGGGFTVPNSEVKDHLGNGYNFNFGVEVKVTPVIGIEGLYSFNGLGDKRISIPVSGTPGGTSVPTDFFASMNMQYGTANLVVQKPDGGVRPYGLVGMGVYYRPIKVTTPAWASCPDTAIRGGTSATREASFPSRTSSANAARPTSAWTSAAA